MGNSAIVDATPSHRQIRALVGADWRPGVGRAKLAHMGVTSGAGGEVIAWLPARPSWTDATGTVWTKAAPRRFARRPATRVALERAPAGTADAGWLDPASQKAWRDRCIAGHVDDGSGRCTPDQDGVTYHVSSWRDPDGHRLILLSGMC